MEKLKEKLTNPFDGLKANDEKGFIEICAKIAEELLNNYGIKCGSKIYYFAEIEFYYWDKSKWNEKWNRITYPRVSDAGDLFYHLSGVDICFKSYYDKENLDGNAKFGGILIRAIRDDKGNITAGPWNCMLKILNECKGGQMPQIQRLDTSCNSKGNIKNTYRSLGDKDMNEEIEMSKETSLNLCFYDHRYLNVNNQLKTNKIALDKKLGKLKSVPRSYKTNRFNQ